MRKTHSLICFLLVVSVQFQSIAFAKDYIHWSLPDGATARLGKGAISGNIAYSPDGMRLVVATTIGVWLYDPHSGTELTLYTGHKYDVNCVAFSPDGRTIASASWASIRLWDAITGTHDQTHTWHSGGVESATFSPDGTTIAAWSRTDGGNSSVGCCHWGAQANNRRLWTYNRRSW